MNQEQACTAQNVSKRTTTEIISYVMHVNVGPYRN